MMIRLSELLLLGLLITACTDDKQSSIIGAKQTSTPELTTAPAVQTANLAVSANPAKTDHDYQAMTWASLELPGQGTGDIMRKYQPLLDKISDDDTAAGDQLMEKMQAEFNAAPINPALNGKKIKLPGFVSPLEVDEQTGQVKEFLLVPYFGACIHVPPPPLNQIILVRPTAGKSITMEQIYEPVTVWGVITTEAANTKLAQAGYQIKEARLEPFKY